MKHLHVLAALLAAVASGAAFAAERSHTYIEAGAARVSEDVPAWFGSDTRFDGGYLRASAALGSTGAYGFGSYRTGSGDGRFEDMDQSRTQLGIGYAHRITPGIELLGEAGYLREAIEGFGRDTGRISAGVQGDLGTRVEAWAKAHYTDRPFDRSRYAGEIGGLVKLTDTWGITGGAELGDMRTEYHVGLRASF